jgi:hypothetical protein
MRLPGNLTHKKIAHDGRFTKLKTICSSFGKRVVIWGKTQFEIAKRENVFTTLLTGFSTFANFE